MTKRKNVRRLKHQLYRTPVGEPPAMAPDELLVEFFSDQELRAWKSRSSEYQQYHYLWYFELEAQRAAVQPQLLDSLRGISAISVDLAGWGRATQYCYSHMPLSCLGSLKWVGGRFNYGLDIDSSRFTPFPALYLAEDLETGLREIQGLTRENTRAVLTPGELNLCAKNGIAWAAVKGSVHNIFDLTAVSNLKPFTEVIASFTFSKAVRDAEKRMQLQPLMVVTEPKMLHQTFLAENWRQYPVAWNTPANPQLLGHLLSLAGFEGVLFSSTRTNKMNLALFTRQFKNSSSTVEVIAPPPTSSCTALSAHTFLDLESQKP